jgi:hypothetical protein
MKFADAGHWIQYFLFAFETAHSLDHELIGDNASLLLYASYLDAIVMRLADEGRWRRMEPYEGPILARITGLEGYPRKVRFTL